MRQTTDTPEIESSNLRLLLSPLFLLGLMLLLLNDFYLKQAFGNFLTGKLSDFAGLFIFPMFFFALNKKSAPSVYVISGLLFILWKSPLSQPFIDLCNFFLPFRIDRVVDYTDLLALSVLPFSYFYSRHCALPSISFGVAKRGLSFIVIILSVFAFTATSFEEDRNIYYDRQYTFKGTKEDMVRRVREIKTAERVELRSRKEVLGNIMAANKIDYEKYHLDIRLSVPLCDSQSLDVALYVKEKNGATDLNLGWIRFWCKEKPTQAMEEQVLRIFEREVVERTGWTHVLEKNERLEQRNSKPDNL